jgi:hypothetical protein
MALISNTDVYNTVLEKGGTKQDAAILALGSTVGMYAVDKYLGLGELFFDDAGGVTKRAIRNVARKEAEKASSQLQNAVASTIDTSSNHILGVF